MKIELFEHNQTAYQAALDMLKTAGKAAIVHPTGTGKSFIGFKLCEDYPDQTICWLSPSEYIFRTQVENLTASLEKNGMLSGGTGRSEIRNAHNARMATETNSGNGFENVLENVRFYTYAKLMSMSETELGKIHPDYIILDEFHRCGAAMWGQGVQKLLSMYPKARVLGLSATAIRYLDNQRDMSDELFDGNVASEMTLGEAIVRGILSPPKYVLSVFSYQKDLAKYERRVRMAKSRVIRDEGEKQLEALRRALEQADGLDEIFRKHMKNRSGKYIVFCANYEHMTEMIGKAPEWFGKVDPNPHIYKAYSDDPETSQAFADFKADGSRHLKLLYCIDMLNEGVHVEDVDGVILLRPTVSPIIYKQQIGRALSAGKKKDAVIFDIVLNIENLYSIGTIEEEMQVAVSYYHFLNREDEIVNEHFRVIDEVQDCIALFEKLEETLTASWDLMYEHAKWYYREHGNLEVPVRYQTEEGYGLGRWLLTQRKVRAGEKYGVLSADRIQKLDRIGMVWGSYRDLSWERYFAEARKYYEEHGNLNTSVNDVADSGIRLGAWICQLRTYRKSGIQKGYLTEDRIRALNEIGMIWDVPDYLWEENFAECLQYYREHGNLDIPNAYISPKGLKIGGWIRRQRLLRKGKTSGVKLTQEQIARLDGIGMVWKTKPEQQWDKGYAEAKAYYEAYGSLNVPVSYVSPSGYKLGHWIVDRREKGKAKHSAERQEQLDALRMVWVKPEPNGYLHIGHAKSILLNSGLAKKYNGTFHLRFDDTNPTKEDMEFVESIKEDVKWLGADWKEHLYFASDYFEVMYECAVKLIRKGKAFVCDLTADEIREYRGTLKEPGKNSPYRDRPVEENLRLFEEMKDGKYKDGEKVLRAKIDMASPNINMRDPVIYRVAHMAHHNTGDRWCIYPMYDFAHPIEDAVEKITHSICTLEFEDHRPLYDWVVKECEFDPAPRQIEFAKLYLTNVVTGKRYIKKLVMDGIVDGWDDPRLVSIAALRRRGFTPESLQMFIEMCGVSKSQSSVDYAMLEYCIREDLKLKRPRMMAILDPIKLVIDNYPEGETEYLEVENNLENPELGMRKLPFGRELYIEREDFMIEPPKKYFRLFPGNEVRLMHAYFVKCISYETDENGNVTVVHATYDPETKCGTGFTGRKVKGTIHWVAAPYAKQAEVRLYENLVDEEKGVYNKEDGSLNLNPNSLIVRKDCYVEDSFADAKGCDSFQFVRNGYFCIDSKDSAPEALVFNRIVSLKSSFKLPK